MKHIVIVSFSDIYRDARVLRQVEYLRPRYRLTVVGHGPDPQLGPGVTYVAAPRFTAMSRIIAGLWLLLGRLWPGAYDRWYWSTRRHRRAFAVALAARPDAVHANDWSALPLAVRLARQTGARVVFDAHEYAPLQFGNRRLRRFLYTPAIRALLARYAAGADAATTVCAPIAERYRDEFGLEMQVVLNAPKRAPALATPREADPERVRLVHHGGALRDRGLEVMVEAVALAQPRFTLEFMLLPTDAAYLDQLKALAARVAPGRVTFREPVPPAEIVPALLAYDAGLCVIVASNYNYRMALPNKLFDFLAAGLAVVVGPSPAMAALVTEQGAGVVAPSFAPADIATTLDALTPGQIAAFRARAREAAGRLNADVEMGRVLAIYARLFGPDTPSPASSA